MRFIIAGSRHIDDYESISYYCNKYIILDVTEVVSGTARGVDALGERWAQENNIPVKRFPAKWDEYGKQAGMIRNAQMAGYADGLIAFWDGKSRGTRHMIDVAVEKGLKVLVVPLGSES